MVMITLKESLLKSTDDKVSGIKRKLITPEKKAFARELKNTPGYYSKPIDDEKYNRLIDTFEEVPADDKKGKLWDIFVPDENGSFKPIAFSSAHFVYRIPPFKELAGTTESALQKRIDKMTKVSRNPATICDNGWTIPHAGVAALYDKVDRCSGSGWYVLSSYSSRAESSDVIYSINPSKKQWCYGCPDNTIPKQFLLDKSHVVKAWSSLCYALTKGYGKLGNSASYIYKDEFVQLRNHLKEVKTTVSKNQDDWVKIGVWDGNWRNHIYDIYVNKTDLTFVMGNKFGDDSETKLAKDLEAIRRGNGMISKETHNYIIANFKSVPTNDVGGRKWYRVYTPGADSKFGRYMVCLDTKERRSQTMDEFYGGGVVD
jgi:hypothetical protein